MSRMYWEHISHPSDMGIRGVGATREQAFAQAAVGLTAIITAPEGVRPDRAVQIECREEDDELLLCKWLSTLLYEMDMRGMLFGRFDVEAIDGGVRAVAWGEPVDVERHEPAVEVKAVTYAGLKVERNEQGQWVVECIVDV